MTHCIRVSLLCPISHFVILTNNWLDIENKKKIIDERAENLVIHKLEYLSQHAISV